jgi:hypothetical protein
MLQDIYVNTRKENKMQKVKIKFSVITPCEKEYEIVDQELWDFGKNRFTEVAKSDDCQQIFSDERIYGLKPIEDSYYEDSPNREVHKVENLVIDGKNQWY